MPYHQLRRPHIHRDSQGLLIIDGYTYLGKMRVPTMPNRIALTDRTTGEILVLSHSGGTIDLVEIKSVWPDVIIYGPYEGPYADGWRLYLDNGSLAFEPAPNHSSARILTRRGFDKTVLELTPDTTDGSVIYTNVTL